MNLASEMSRPLIRYAGSAAETSIGSKPMGSELIPKSTCLVTAVKVRAHQWIALLGGDPLSHSRKLLNPLGHGNRFFSKGIDYEHT